MHPRSMSALCIAAIACVVLAAGPTSGARATTSLEALGFLNQQRVASGLAALTPNPALDDGCAKHVNYIALNGGGLRHGEDPSAPGYTPEGSGATVSASEVLAGGPPEWSATTHPWMYAPLHEATLYHFFGGTFGYAEQPHAPGQSFVSCGRVSTTQRLTGDDPRFFSVPGNGAQAYPVWWPDDEIPYQPAALVGIQGAAGPVIHIFHDGFGRPDANFPQSNSDPAMSVVSAFVSGPDGPVTVRWVDRNTPGHTSGLQGHAMLFVVSPLQPLAQYTARVVWKVAADGATPERTAEQSIAFQTRQYRNVIEVDPSFGPRGGADVTVRGLIGGRPIAPRGSLTLTGPQGQTRDYPPGTGNRKEYSDGGFSVSFIRGLPPGQWTACSTSGGTGSLYEAATACAPFDVTAVPAQQQPGPAKLTLRLLTDRVTRRSTLRRTRTLRIRLALDSPGSVTIRATLTAASARRLGLSSRRSRAHGLMGIASRVLRLSASRTTTIRLRPARRTVRALVRPGPSATVTVTAQAIVPGRAPVTLRATTVVR